MIHAAGCRPQELLVDDLLLCRKEFALLCCRGLIDIVHRFADSDKDAQTHSWSDTNEHEQSSINLFIQMSLIQ